MKSNAPGLRDATLRPGPAFPDVRPWPEKTQTDLIDPPSVLERHLRLRIGEMIADEAGLAVPRGRGRLKATATLPSAIARRHVGTAPMRRCAGADGT